MAEVNPPRETKGKIADVDDGALAYFQGKGGWLEAEDEYREGKRWRFHDLSTAHPGFDACVPFPRRLLWRLP
jgi:hypothetical protein